MAYTKRPGTAQTRDGIALHYTVHGDDAPGQPRIVLVHSLGMSEVVWESVVERLVARATVLTYDCRGHGASTKSPGPYRLETFASDLVDLLDHVGWHGAHVAGASLGGNVSLQCATSYPARVLALGLIDTTAWYGPEGAQQWDQRARKAEGAGLTSLIEFQEQRWFSDGFRAQHTRMAALCRSVFLANEVACFAATCRMLGAFDLRPGLGSLRVPTAIVVGEEDYATPLEMARGLQGGITGATLQVIPGARHLTFVECPGIIAQALSDLMARVSTAA